MMSNYDDPKRWEARDLPGGVYCSPRCGCGCTRADYERATSQGAEMAASLGEGWQVRVWENGGWHCEATKGVARVTQNYVVPYTKPRKIENYTAWINSDVFGQIIVEDPDPVAALGLALQAARTSHLRYEAELNEITA